MTIKQLQNVLKCKCLTNDAEETLENNKIESAFACDMLSEVLAFGKGQELLITGLTNPQVIITCKMLDISCILYVRSKQPNEDFIKLAKENGIVVLATGHRMFTACGILYEAGIK
ncbi:MAG: DRTGG domain-containing protein [Eubacteriales bacterium]|nr:DRTGG domain-containing protein [Eubacteriales bacterium]